MRTLYVILGIAAISIGILFTVDFFRSNKLEEDCKQRVNTFDINIIPADDRICGTDESLVVICYLQDEWLGHPGTDRTFIKTNSGILYLSKHHFCLFPRIEHGKTIFDKYPIVVWKGKFSDLIDELKPAVFLKQEN